MKVDLYMRSEPQGTTAYLAVPQGRPIPEEATSIDWETADTGVDLDPDNEPVAGLPADDALNQISAKGYAISSAKHRLRIGPSV